MFPRRTEAGQAPPPRPEPQPITPHPRQQPLSPAGPARATAGLPRGTVSPDGGGAGPGLGCSPPPDAPRTDDRSGRRGGAAGLRGRERGGPGGRGARKGRPPGAAFPARRVPLAAARTRGTPRPALGVSATAAAAAVWGNAAGQGAPRAQSALMRASSLPASPPPPPPRDQAPCRAASRAAAAACPRRGASPEAEGRALERGPDLSRTRGVSATPGPELAPEAPGGGVRAPAWPSRRGALVAPRGRWPAGGGWG